MSQEVYNYVVQSPVINNILSSLNLIKNSTNNCTYQIQWQNIIPSKYSNNKLLLRMRFSSQIEQTYTDVGAFIVSANFGNTYVFDNSTAQSSIIGIINPIGCNSSGVTAAQAYYSCGAYDNPPVLMNYPDSQQLTISFNNISANSTNPNIWVLILSFEIVK